MSMDVTVVETGPRGPSSAVAWGAVMAGGLAASTLSLALLFLCGALGLMMVSPWSAYSVSAATFVITGAIGMILVQWISAGVGGYLAGRLRRRYEDTGDDEVFFRDTANGFLAWCVATLVVAVVTGLIALGAARTGTQAAASVAAAATSTQSPADQTAYFVDVLFRGQTASPATGTQDARAEVGRILARSAAQGQLTDADRTYLAQRVAQVAGISEEDTRRRIGEIETQARNLAQQAREAAEKARKAAALGSLFTFLSLLVGAFIAAAAAAFGATFRDDYRRTPAG